ncbi:MAG: hypothetical protein RJA49_562 [Actinomycetota bacterium]|jgi:glutaredoxin-like protein
MDAPTTPPITVYWRPGCPFCGSLHRAMVGAGLQFSTVNIWEDADAATFVRSVARGNETVPTVTVGDVALVNPSISELRRVLDTATS